MNDCAAAWGGVTVDCRDAVLHGEGRFRQVPASARKEFAYLFAQSCAPDIDQETCTERIQRNRAFRELPRGRLDPQPLSMDEGERTRFIVYIRDQGFIRGEEGLSTDVAYEAIPGQPARRIPVMPYTRRMCFRLWAEDPSTARIEPDPRADRTTEPPDRVCMAIAEGATGIKFDPSWWVTPLSAKDMRLYFDAEHYVGQERRDFKHEPRPIHIEVVGAPSWWDRLDAFLSRATGTVGLATRLAQAIGALFAAVAGWLIWKWIRQWLDRRGREPKEAPAR